MKSLALFPILILICLSTLLHGQRAQAALPPRCEVKVSFHMKSGAIQEAKVRPRAASKAECRRKARSVKIYSAPTQSVRRKVVAINWNDRPLKAAQR